MYATRLRWRSADLPLTAGHVLAQRMWIEAFEEYYQ
jgi:hypothetical protein